MGLDTTNAGGSFTYNTVIGNINSGANIIGLTKLGAGTLILSSNNTYTGATNVNGGVLDLNTPNFNVFSGSVVNINNGSTLQITQSGGAVRYDFGTTTFNFDATGGDSISIGAGTNWVAQGTWTFVTNGGASDSISGVAGLNMNGQSAVFNVARGTDPTSDLTVSAAISNTSGGLTKTGAGILALSGANTYTGGTTISSGSLQIGNGGTTGSLSTSSTITDNASLIFNRTNAVTQGTDFSAAAIGGTGSVSQNGTGTLILTAANTYSGITTINSGALQVGNGSTIGTLGTGNVTDNASLIFNHSDAVTIANIISGTGGLVQAGTGTLILTGANTWSGTTTISNGTLQIGNGGTIGAIGSGAITDNASLIFSHSDTVNVTNVLGGTGGITQAGAGTLNFNDTPTIGALTINSGTVNINNGLTASGSVTASSGTLNITGQLTTTTLNIGAGAVHIVNPGTFNPNSITGLQAQLDASGLSTGAITTWSDAYPAGNFTGGGTVQSGGAGFNNKNVVHFNGSQTLINATNFSGGAVTVIYVGSLDGTQNARLVSATGNNWLLGYWGGDQNEAYFNGWVSNPGTGASTTPMIYEGTIDASGNSVAYNNGTVLGTSTGNQGPNGLSLGGNDGAGNNNAEDSKGSVGELLVYNSVLTSTQRASIEAYLNYKWFGIGGGSLSTTTAVNITGGGTFDLNGINQTVASLNGTGGNVTLGGATLTTGGDNSNATFAGIISGTGGLTKQGTGIQIISGANTYTSTTTISGGKLQIGNGSTSGTLGTGNVTNNANLTFNRTDNYGGAISNIISGTGSVVQSGTGVLTLIGTAGITAYRAVKARTIAGNNHGGVVECNVARHGVVAFKADGPKGKSTVPPIGILLDGDVVGVGGTAIEQQLSLGLNVN